MRTLHGKNLISPEDRLVLHLSAYKLNKKAFDLPIAMTREGIAKATGIGLSHVSRQIRKLIEKGYLKTLQGRAKGMSRKQNFYFLSADGKKYAESLIKSLKDTEITVSGLDEDSKRVRYYEVLDYLREKNISNVTELDICKFTSEEGVLHVKNLKTGKKKEFVDFTEGIPKVTRFFGRKEEMKKLEGWITDKDRHNIIFIHGIAGIGKTTLAMKLAENYRDSKHIFYHSFHSLDTLRGLLSLLASFLSKTGNDNLEFRLKVHKFWDVHEIYSVISKDLRYLDAILVFDDFHKVRDEIRQFFTYVLKILSNKTNTKMVVLAREKISFYDIRDILKNEIVCEMELEGLDFESSKRLLEEKGIDKKMFKEIYKATAGNPLFLEIFEIEDERERYVHEEMFSKLSDEERDLLGVISVYRFPVRKEALLFDNISSEALYTLLQKSLVKKNAKGEYFTHDFIKQFFYSRLPLALRIARHKFAARWYKNKEKPLDYIESVYHYVKAGEYEIASKLAVEFANIIIDSGLAAQFLVVLGKLDEKDLRLGLWAEMLLLKGKASSVIGEWDKALTYYSQCVHAAAELDNNEIKAKALCESGHILEEKNHFDEAMDCFKKSLRISDKADYLSGIGNAYRGIGRVHWRKSQHRKAIANYMKCLEISEKLGDLEMMASVYIDMGNAYDERYEIKKAIGCYNKSLDILRKVKNAYETARAYGNLGVTYWHLEDFKKAIEYQGKQLKLAQNLNDIKMIGYSYSYISYCFARIGEFEKARGFAEKAEDIALKMDNENIMYSLNKAYALIYKHENRWDEAKRYLQKCIEMLEKQDNFYGLSESHFELGLLYKDMGDAKNAKKHLGIAAKLYDKLGLGNVELVREKLSKYEDVTKI